MSEKKKNKAAQQEAVTEETASAAQAGAPEQEGQPAAPAEDSTQAVQAALAEKEDQYLRLAAEYDNYRKRTAKEKETIYQDAKVDTVKAFLAVYDNLERAVATDADPDSPHRKGLELIFSQFKEILKKLGVEEMEALGQPFDPQRHNAVMHIESEDLGENVVSQVFQAGFTLDGKVVRFAIVQVAN